LLLLLLLLLLLVILLSLFAFDFSGAPIRSDGASGQKPRRGGVHGCTSFSAAAWMPRQKIPLAQ
jgi:hypothetical protein